MATLLHQVSGSQTSGAAIARRVQRILSPRVTLLPPRGLRPFLRRTQDWAPFLNGPSSNRHVKIGVSNKLHSEKNDYTTPPITPVV